MQQEYINITRGMLKTCMWVEKQPFGTPSDTPKRPKREFVDGSHCEERCTEYALKRNEYIRKHKLPWISLDGHKDMRHRLFVAPEFRSPDL